MFEKEYFHRMNFTKEQIQMFLNSGRQSLEIAKQSSFAEVKFKFAYEALIKAGIALIASKGFKIRSTMGHHIKILETMSEIIKDEDIEVVGNIMRNKRNNDLYTGGVVVSKKKAENIWILLKSFLAKLKICFKVFYYTNFLSGRPENYYQKRLIDKEIYK